MNLVRQTAQLQQSHTHSVIREKLWMAVNAMLNRTDNTLCGCARETAKTPTLRGTTFPFPLSPLISGAIIENGRKESMIKRLFWNVAKSICVHHRLGNDGRRKLCMTCGAAGDNSLAPPPSSAGFHKHRPTPMVRWIMIKEKVRDVIVKD